MNITINTDGGSRGNPGPAAIGIVIKNDQQTIETIKQTLGVATNNEAEYTAIKTSLSWLMSNIPEDVSHIAWKLDSQLVVEQLNKRWKIKDARMLALAQDCWKMLAQLQCSYTIAYVPRAENSEADALVNQALDESANA